MAEEDKKDEAELDESETTEGSEPRKPKTLLKVVGGVVAVVGLAFAAAVMAVPSKPERHTFQGPFTAPLTEGKISVNLKDNQYKRYLQMQLHCEYYTYEPEYFPKRVADPLFNPRLQDAIQRVTTARSSDQVTGPVNQPVFIQEIVQGIDPVIFPVHIGDVEKPTAIEKKSGLRPGFSAADSTFRGLFHDHVLHVDGVARTLQIDDGPVTSFEGDEIDLELQTVDAKTFYVDVTTYNPEFVGDLRIGVHGKLAHLLIEHWLLQ